MKQKKFLVGVVAVALVLSTGVVTYATKPQISDWFVTQVKGEISADGSGILSFDKTNLTKGVQYKDKVSIGDGEGILTFGDTKLPQGAQLVQEIFMGDIKDEQSFDETDLPEGVQYKDEVSNGVINGVKEFE